MGKKITLWSLFRNAKYRWVSMRKYKMCLPLWYVLRHVFTFEKYSSGKLWQFRFICTYGFDIDFRGDNFLDYFLTENEKEKFWMRWFSVRN